MAAKTDYINEGKNIRIPDALHKRVLDIVRPRGVMISRYATMAIEASVSADEAAAKRKLKGKKT